MNNRTTCETCDGEGQIIHAITREDQSGRVCPDCLGKGLCPLCGFPVEFEGRLFGGGLTLPVCAKKCGWILGA